MTRLDEILDLYRYDGWANARVLEAAGRLPPDGFTRGMGSSFPSVRDTLVHILASQWVWLSRWEGTSPRGMPEGWAEAGFDELEEHWRAFESRQAAFLASLTEDRLDEVLEYRTTAGVRYRSPLWQMLRHVVNHSTYHRGQVVTMLRQLGAEAPATDLIRYYREEGKGG